MTGSESYSPVPSADDESPVGSAATCQDDGVATQLPDLERAQDAQELRGRERSLRRKVLAAGCLLAALAFGGREYYARNYGGGSGLEGARLFAGGRIRGSDGGIPVGLEDDEFLGGEDALALAEGDLDDEIENALEDYLGGLVDVRDEDSAKEEEDNSAEGESSAEESPEEDEDANGEMEEEEEEEEEDLGGLGDVHVEDTAKEEEDNPAAGESPAEESPAEESPAEEFPNRNEDATGEIEEEEEEEEDSGDLGDVHAEDAAKEEEGNSAEGELPAESPEEGFVPEEETPEYFVPLAPHERDEMKERLRATVRATRDALLRSDRGGDGEVHPAPQRTLVLGSDMPKQFMHMHHMKTGGTSLDGLIHCALSRQKALHGGNDIYYTKVSECGSGVRFCMEDLARELGASVINNVFYRNDEAGEPKIAPEFSFDPAEEDDVSIDDLNICKTSQANVMSYCASLHAVRTFGWEGVDKITVIRDPIDRAWSMYRFQLQGCYKCEELKDVLKKVLNGTFEGRKGRGKGPSKAGKGPHEGGEDGGVGGAAVPNYVYDPNDSCAVQMIGHQATNLLSSVELYNVANDARFPREREIVEEAVRNLRETFTWIGITDRIEESVEGFRAVFPFLAENLNDAAGAYGSALQKGGEEVDGGFALPEGYADAKECPFEHRNAGRDPSCGTKEMDEETIHLIKKLAARDIAVYQAAVERFELQQEVLVEFWNGTL